jgi:seryl-tRNA synthetase
MEITLEAIISLLGLFVGGGGGAFFTWRFLRRKAKAEAVTAEIDATKDMQDMYQQMLEDAKKDREDRREQVEELRADRDHYKAERNELRERMEQLAHSFMDWRLEADNDRSKMKMDIAKLGRKVETMVPFMCGDLTCKDRQRVVLADDGTVKSKPRKKGVDAVAEPRPAEKDDAAHTADGASAGGGERKMADIDPIESEAL